MTFNINYDDTEKYTSGRPGPSEEDPEQVPDPDYEEEKEGRMSGKAKGLILFFSAVAVFLGAVGMCIGLTARSATLEALPSTKTVQPMLYRVNQEVPDNPAKLSDYTAPVSRYNSEIVNFLVLCVDGEKSETFMLLSVNMTDRKVALLSLPRDTYISGEYETPALSSVYTAHVSSGRGTQALVELIGNQIGFVPDYYLVLDEASLEAIFEITGDIEFEVPESPNYSGLDAGVQNVGSWSALKLLSCKDGFSYVETDSTQVQRDLLLSMITALLQRSDNIEEDMTAVKNVMDTDLTFENLAYMMYFMQGVDFAGAPNACLPGEIIEVDGAEYYQVDPQGACDLLNLYFNPYQTDLDPYTVSFRQLQGDATDGEWTDYKSEIVSTTPTTKPSTKPTTPTESTKPTESTEPSTKPTEPDTKPEVTESPATPEEPNEP